VSWRSAARTPFRVHLRVRVFHQDEQSCKSWIGTRIIFQAGCFRALIRVTGLFILMENADSEDEPGMESGPPTAKTRDLQEED